MKKIQIFFFKYIPNKINFKKNKTKLSYSDSPFRKLEELNIK